MADKAGEAATVEPASLPDSHRAILGKASEGQSPPTDVKEFCEHIRTVQLSLLGICLLLLGVAFRTEPRPLSTAIANVEKMATFGPRKAQINSALQIYVEEVFDSYSRNNEPKLQMGKPTYILGQWLDGTKRSFRLDFPLLWVGHGPFTEDGTKAVYRAQTPQEFQEFWENCRVARIRATPAFTDAESIWFTDANTRRPGNEGKVLVHTTSLDSFTEKVRASVLPGEIKSNNLLNPLPLTLHLDVLGSGFNLRSQAIDSTKEVQLHLPELPIEVDMQPAFLRATGMLDKWQRGPFGQVFGELSTQMRVISGLQFKDAKDYLGRQSTIVAPEETVDVFGAKLPVAKITNFGIVIVLGVQLYLLILLSQLSFLFSISRPSVLCWSGLFPSRIARGFTLVSCALLPVAVLSHLEVHKWPNNIAGELLYPLSIVLSLILCFGAIVKLREVWAKQLKVLG